MAPTEADAKMVVATGRDDCMKLKDLVNQQDATTTMVVVMASKQASRENPSPATMHPLLAAAACRGNLEELSFLLNRESSQPQPSENLGPEFLNLVAAYFSCTNRSSVVMQQAAGDLEVGIPGEPLLQGVTVEGDTALHLVAANGQDGSFLDCARLIHCKDNGLLLKDNNKGDTPLHCAARAGKTEMVYLLIALASGNLILEQLLRKENKRKETALHEAVRIGDDELVKELLRADPELACFPNEGTSPLYLAISLERDNIAEALHDESRNNVLSYLGPKGQNALHAAVLRGPVLTGKVLEWNTNKDLTTQRDEKGRTPLHFAAGGPGSVCSQVFEAHSAAIYQPDNDGLSPIHVAASVGAVCTVAMFVKKCPSSAGLRDAKERTFLHVAVEKKVVSVVCFACIKGSQLAWTLNMQDNDGNTALHLAIQAANLPMFCSLLGNRQVQLNITNEAGLTPLDLSRIKIPKGIDHFMNSHKLIYVVLRHVILANHSTASRSDHHSEEHTTHLDQNEDKESNTLSNSTQALGLGAVLIATVTFGTTFALPGGYIADDHTNGGSPTLAGRYVFDAFMMANTLAFVCSATATVGLAYSGASMIDLETRRFHFYSSVCFLTNSVASLTVAFALGVYMVLAPIAHKTAIAICLISPLVVIYRNVEYAIKLWQLTPPLCVRIGPVRVLKLFAFGVLGNLILMEFWPFIVIFSWAAYAQSHRHH